jgi:hypothetical protein
VIIYKPSRTVTTRIFSVSRRLEFESILVALILTR